MVPNDSSAGRAKSGHYDANYGNFASDLYSEIRREAFGDDIGQNSWMTAAELDSFVELLLLSPGKSLLDVACGSGGPALRLAASTGCSVTGIDLHESAIAAAKSMAAQRNLAKRAQFSIGNAAERLPFPDAAFDAILCIDAINHLPDRPRVLAEWARLLKPGGRLLLTDATTVTGPLTKEEIAIRSSIGFFLFVPLGYDERVLVESGFHLLASKDTSAATAEIGEKRRAAREARSAALRQVEGASAFDAQQTFLGVASQLARERRLSRYLYLAQKL
jgi:ubiquinone/menaquinone biosynthesis C-methylase UbiE